MKTRKAIGFVVASVGLVSCGGTEPSKKISDLNDEEKAAFCDSYRSWSAELDRDFDASWCRAYAVDDAVQVSCGDASRLQNECRISFDECSKRPAQPHTAADCSPDATCAATVSEVEKCFADFRAVQKAFFDAYPACELLTAAPPGSGDDGGEPDSCRLVHNRCRRGLYRLPGLLALPLEAIQIFGLEVMPTSATLLVGVELQFAATVSSDHPRQTACRRIYWSSSDPSIVAIDVASGLARALKPGTATIAAGDGIVEGKARVTVNGM